MNFEGRLKRTPLVCPNTRAWSSECTREFGTIKNCAADINQNGEVAFPSKRRASVLEQCESHLLIGTFMNGGCTWSHWTFVVPLRMSVLLLACLLYSGRLFIIATMNMGWDVIIPTNVDEFNMVVED